MTSFPSNEPAPIRPLNVLVKIILFSICICAAIIVLSNLLVPSFGREGDGVEGMYLQPSDTIQVGCFGGSSMAAGFAPTWLFTKYGICSYNTSSSNQSSLSSYYLLKDLLERQSGSLSVVIIDAMPLVKDDSRFNSFVWSERVASSMPFSLNRIAMLRDLSNTYETYDFAEHLIPLLSYHDRWDELNDGDFSKVFSTTVDTTTHGQNYGSVSFISNVSKGKAAAYSTDNLESITEDLSYDSEALAKLWNPSSAAYIKKMIQLCNDNHIKTLLVKTPAALWTDRLHDSVALFASETGADYFDMNLPAIWNATGLSFSQDYRDGKHVNIRGGLKVTEAIGQYLADHYDFRDIPNLASVFTQDDLSRYGRMVESSQLLFTNDLVSYLKMINQKRYTVLVAVGEQSSEVINDEAREELRKMGLGTLAGIAPGTSYVGIVSNGKLVAEDTAKEGEKAFISGVCADGRVLVKDTKMQPGASFDHPLKMAGQNLKSAIKVDEKKVSDSAEGINFVVYDNELGLLVDTSSFDIRATPNRLSDQEPVAQEEQAS